MTTALQTPVDAHQEWLEERRRFIGGSDSASLFPEESVYGCDTRLFFDKSGIEPDYPRTQREENLLKRGHIWENVVALYFQEHTGFKIRRIGARTSKDHPALGVNMDRQIIGVTTEDLKAVFPSSPEIQAMEGACGPGYLECKTANEFAFKQMLERGVTTDYVFQVNHGLAVTGYRWGIFAVLEPTWGNFATFPFVFKENLAQEQIRRAEAFWDALRRGELPVPKISDKRCKSCLWRRSCPRSQELLAQADKEFFADGYVVDESLAELVADYQSARELVDEHQQTADAIKERLQEALGDRQKVEVPSVGVRISWATSKPPMRWDSKALEGTVKELSKTEPEIAEQVAACRRAGEPSRPFKIMVA
jgi:predicted phage-related endonuclease